MSDEIRKQVQQFIEEGGRAEFVTSADGREAVRFTHLDSANEIIPLENLAYDAQFGFYDEIKVAFLPRHRVCGRIVGGQVESVDEVKRGANMGEYECLHCYEPIVDEQEIEIQIIFGKPG